MSSALRSVDDLWLSLFERRCARCDYDLSGHPRGPTVCPECGETLDEQLLVLRGSHGGGRRGELRTWPDFLRMAVTLAAVLVVLNYVTSFPLMMLFFVAIFTATFVVEPYVRKELDLGAAQRAKLLIRREGFWQVDTAEAMNGRRHWLISRAGYVALIMMCVVVGGTKYLGVWGGLYGAFIGAAIANRKREKLARSNAHLLKERGQYMPWSAVTRFKISPTTWLRKTHVLSVECHRVTSWSRTALVDFDWPTTPELAWQLANLLTQLARSADRDIHGMDRLKNPPAAEAERLSLPAAASQ